MKRLAISIALLFAAYVLLGMETSRAAGPTLTLAEYMNQVEGKNDALAAAEGVSTGAALRAEEARLLYTPNFFATTSYTIDKSQTSTSFARESQRTTFYQAGISQGTSFGLTGRLYYNLYDIQTRNPANPAFFDEGGTYWAGKPFLELSQSLWRNGFGSETRAQVELGEASAKALSYNEGFRATLIRAEAERAYWRLAAARLMVQSQSESLDRSQRIRAYQGRRARLELTDRVDLLQSDASYQLRSLELKTAVDEERTAARAFNLTRGIDSDVVKEQLPMLTTAEILAAAPPARAAMREDVKAAESQVRVAQAAAKIGLEKQKPTLDLFAASNLSGRDRRFGPAWDESTSFDYGTHAVGVRFSVPLNPSQLSQNRKGYRAEVDAADHTLQKRLLDQESDWKDLGQRLTEAKARLALAVKLEEAQQSKMVHERNRQERGRTTTFQVLSFEQDFSFAQTTRIRAQFDVLSVLAQMKLYTDRGIQ